MISRHDKNSRVLKENYDNWKTSLPDYSDEEKEEEYFEKHGRPDSTDSKYNKLLTYDDLFFYCEDVEEYCDFLEKTIHESI